MIEKQVTDAIEIAKEATYMMDMEDVQPWIMTRTILKEELKSKGYSKIVINPINTGTWDGIDDYPFTFDLEVKFEYENKAYTISYQWASTHLQSEVVKPDLGF